MAALAFVAVTKVVQTRADARDANEQADLALSATGPGSVIDRLKDERNHTAAHLSGSEAMVNIEVGAYLDARPATDEALEQFREVVAGANDQVQAAYEPAIAAMDGLAELRARVDAYTGPRDFNNAELMQEVFDGYSQLITELFDANRQVSLAVNDLVLRRGAALVNLTTRNSDTVAVLTRTLVMSAVAGDRDGLNTPGEITRAAELLSQLRRNEASIRENGVGVYREYVERLFAAEHTQRFPAAVESALETGVVDMGTLLGNAGDREAFGYDDLLRAVTSELEREADALKDDAQRTEQLFLVFGVVILLLGGVMTLLVSMSITRPLRSLTRQATAMAHEHLPGAVLDILETPLGEDVTVPEMTPIRINTRDEVADVADALNTVQQSALDLAVEQAVLRRNIADSFVNLGRRNQNLLSRQLDFITELERNETDPDVLASLFRLDHLATRMRRNAESLLVLAGIEPPRKWAAPVRLTDVIRAALSEIEDYQRVTVAAVEPATIVGSAAADLAHLLAELMENAVTFSPPDQNVEVRGRSQGSGYVLAVIDQGLGMEPAEIEAANRRLSGSEAFTVAPSKYLGHYVTGNLAARHNIEVRLQSSPVAGIGGGGITATVVLPETLLVRDQGAGVGAPTAGAAAAAGGRPTAQTPVPALATVGAAAGGDRAEAGGAGGDGAWRGNATGNGTAGNGNGRGSGSASGGETARPTGTSTPWAAAAGAAGQAWAPPGGSGGSGATGGSGDLGGPGGPAGPGGLGGFGGPVGPGAPAGPGAFPGQGATAPWAAASPGTGPGSQPGGVPPAAWSPGPTGAGGTGGPAPSGPGGGAAGSSPSSEPAAREQAGRRVFDALAALPTFDKRRAQGRNTSPFGTPAATPGPGDAGGSGDASPTAPFGSPATRASDGGPGDASGPSGPSSPSPGTISTPKYEVTPPRGTPTTPRRSPDSGGTTAAGLARRVRGANLPTARPLGLRRSSGNLEQGPPTPADDVYSFLSNFQAGVQRGLDAARNENPDDQPGR